jgi:hypothetical protein
MALACRHKGGDSGCHAAQQSTQSRWPGGDLQGKEVLLSRGTAVQLGNVYAAITGKALGSAHTALADADALVEIAASLWSKEALISSKYWKKSPKLAADLYEHAKATFGVDVEGLHCGSSDDDEDVVFDLDDLASVEDFDFDNVAGQFDWVQVEGEGDTRQAGFVRKLPEQSLLKMPVVFDNEQISVEELKVKFAMPLLCFNHYFSSVRDLIVAETNRYANQKRKAADASAALDALEDDTAIGDGAKPAQRKERAEQFRESEEASGEKKQRRQEQWKGQGQTEEQK